MPADDNIEKVRYDMWHCRLMCDVLATVVFLHASGGGIEVVWGARRSYARHRTRASAQFFLGDFDMGIMIAVGRL